MQEKLKPPLLVCRVGRLYNKEKVINAILQKTLPPHMKHVRSIKDMKDCNVEVRREPLQIRRVSGFRLCVHHSCIVRDSVGAYLVGATCVRSLRSIVTQVSQCALLLGLT